MAIDPNKKIFFGLCLLGAMVLLSPLVVFGLWRFNLGGEIYSQVASVRAAGLPIDWEELSRWQSPVRDEDNLALIYTNAFTQIQETNILDKYDFLRERLLTAVTISNATRVVSSNQTALLTIYHAPALIGSRYMTRFDDGPNTKLPHLPGVRLLSKLTVADACGKAQVGNAAGAARAVEASFDVARSLDGEPLLISQLVNCSCLTAACESFERVLGKAEFADEDLGKIDSRIKWAEATNQILTGLIGERALNAEFMRLAQDDFSKYSEVSYKGSTDSDRVQVPLNPGIGWRFLGFFDRDRNYYLRAVATNILAVETPAPQCFSMTNEIDDLNHRALNRMYLLSSLELPSYSKLVLKHASLQAELRIAIVAVAVEKWRNSHNGQLPQKIDLLVPTCLAAIPLDPFDGKPVRFKPLSKGYVVYSVGPDQKDDQGTERPRTGKAAHDDSGKPYDITFIVER